MTTRRRGYDTEDNEPKRRKNDNDNNAPSVSRACRICATEVSRFISVFTPCGHPVCRGCSLKLRLDALDTAARLLHIRCPSCRGQGKFVAMKEETIANPGTSGATGERDDTGLEEFDVDDENLLAEAHESVQAYLTATRAVAAAAEAGTKALDEHADRIDDAIAAMHVLTALHRKTVQLMKFRLAECSETRAEARDQVARYAAASVGWAPHEAIAAIDDAEAKRSIAEAVAKSAQDVHAEATANRQIAHADYYDVKRARIVRLMDRLKTANEESAARGLRFTRVCRACSTDHPRLRSFFPACGHAVCRVCADKAASEADTQCPTCNTEGNAIPLFEELIDGEEHA